MRRIYREIAIPPHACFAQSRSRAEELSRKLPFRRIALKNKTRLTRSVWRQRSDRPRRRTAQTAQPLTNSALAAALRLRSKGRSGWPAIRDNHTHLCSATAVQSSGIGARRPTPVPDDRPILATEARRGPLLTNVAQRHE